MQRHMTKKHSNATVTSFEAISISIQKCQRFYLHGCRNDWFGEDVLDSTFVSTGLRND